jgi:hypothetical protein
MANNENKSNVVGQTIATVVVALLVGGTSPWWWNEFFGKDSQSNSPSPTPTNSLLPNDSSPSPSPIQRTSISVAYRGDGFGCSLPLSIQIGDQKFYPQGYFFEVNGIMTGQQGYQIDGQIQCPTIGTCQVYGQGFVEVVSSRTYYLVWQNTALGQCQATLQ